MYGLLLVVAVILIIFLAICLYQKSTNAVCMSRRDLKGRTVLVTGGSTGMGLVIATETARLGARVIIACPFDEEGEDAKKKIIQQTENENVEFINLDVGSLKSVRNFAKDMLKTEKRLDILVNNAAVGFPDDFVTTDGMSFVMQVNYYGTFLLTLLLLPLLKKTGQPGEPSRILTTSSISHWMGSYDTDKFNIVKYSCCPIKNMYIKIKVYSNSKLSLLLFVNELSKRLEGSNVVINSVDPGAVGTNIFAGFGYVVGTLATAYCVTMFKNTWEGAQTALHAALDKKAGEVNGKYFKNCQIHPCVERGNEKTTKKLWEHTIQHVRLTEEEIMHLL